MKGRSGTDDTRASMQRENLMAEANAENRDLSEELCDERQSLRGILGAFRPGRKDERIRLQSYAAHGVRIVEWDQGDGEAAVAGIEPIYDVAGEAVIMIDEHNSMAHAARNIAMTKRLHNLAATIAAFWGAGALAVDTDGSRVRQISTLSRPTLVEPAGSHGTIGTSMGVGAAQSPGTEGTDDERVPMAWLVKGTPWPVDFGLSAGAAPDATYTLMAGHAQVTVLERLRLPAISVRGGYGRVFGLGKEVVTTTSVDLVASYGFLRYFTLYGVGGMARSDAGTTTATAPTRAGGLKVAIIPPFVTLTGEAAFEDGEVVSAAAKLGVGI